MLNKESIFDLISVELDNAKIIHPFWPSDKLHQVAIMCEESGETVKAVLDYHFNKGSISDIRKELIQTAAMCVRMIETL